MKPKDLLKLARDPRFISGIYNYCDRWCERCRFTDRCLNFAQSSAALKRHGIEPDEFSPEHEQFAETIQDVFSSTHDLIQEIAREQGIDLDAIDDEDTEKAMADRRRREREARNHPLHKAAMQYAMAMHQWFQEELEDPEETQLHKVDDIDDAETIESVEDALEVIRWYQFLPTAKLYRALYREADDDDEVFAEINKKDADGTIKVALIAMDRSLLAWERLQRAYPTKALLISPLKSKLEMLRRDTELLFPDARNFIRPGFDESVDYVM